MAAATLAMLAAAATLQTAIVTTDQAVLRAAPRDSAAAQTQLWQGEALEVRGERLDYLQVWDHARERGGFVKATQVRRVALTPAEAPDLLAVLRFLRDQPGAESLGVAYAAAYFKAAPAAQPNPEAWDALGQMADRLAQRGSARAAVASAQAGLSWLPAGGAGPDARLAGQLDGVAVYGVRFVSWEQGGAVRLCYDGEAFRRVLALAASTPAQRAQAALALSRPDCLNPGLRASEREAWLDQRTQWLDAFKLDDWNRLNDGQRQRIRLRRAGLWAELAHAQALRGLDALPTAGPAPGQAAGQRAVDELAAVEAAKLDDDDQGAYREAALRVGASRWAALPRVAATGAPHGPRLQLVAGTQPGERCVVLREGLGAGREALRRCTWGVPWMASARVRAQGDAVALAVQPLAHWRELWLMRRDAQGQWTLDVLPPAPGDPASGDYGYAEFAGWAAEAQPQMLLAREARVESRPAAVAPGAAPPAPELRWVRRFEAVELATGTVARQGAQPDAVPGFKRWRDPDWARMSVALR